MASQQNYLVSARKYRPGTFNTVVGQRALTATLKNAITSGRLAHAYLFCGPRGVGKTSCARIFAKTINCLSPTPEGEACGHCESCKAIDNGNSFNLVELDAASNNSVNDIRDINEQVHVPPQVGHYRVFIIDEVHMLSSSAFNAFLKTLEEPPENVIFILATTERHKVIPTILSRCQVYDFRRITVKDIIDHLDNVAKTEGITAEREALGIIAQQADGAMRDALSIFDQVAASTQGNITYESTIEALNALDKSFYFRLMEIFKEGDIGAALLLLKEITDKGFDRQFFLNGLAEHIRNLMVAQDKRTLPLLETSEELENKYSQQSSIFPPVWYYNAIKILNDSDFQYRTTLNKSLLTELTLIRLCRLLKPENATPGIAVNSVDNMSAQKPSSPSKVPFAKPAETNPPVRPETQKPEDDRQKPKTDPHIFPRSFRISHTVEDNTPSLTTDKRKKNFTEKDFLEAWSEYARYHPEQRILNGAMRTITPVTSGDYKYIVKAAHPAQKQAFEAELSSLSNFLRDKLENDFITLHIDIDDTSDQHKILTPREMLKDIIDNNAELANFLRAIDAELE